MIGDNVKAALKAMLDVTTSDINAGRTGKEEWVAMWLKIIFMTSKQMPQKPILDMVALKTAIIEEHAGKTVIVLKNMIEARGVQAPKGAKACVLNAMVELFLQGAQKAHEVKMKD